MGQASAMLAIISMGKLRRFFTTLIKVVIVLSQAEVECNLYTIATYVAITKFAAKHLQQIIM